MEFRQCLFESPDELIQLIELQNKVYSERGLHFETDVFKRWYVDNPEGSVISFNAFDNGRMVAHQSFVPERMWVCGRVVRCLRSMAVVTDPDYRKRGLLAQLTNLTFDEAERQGYEFVIGIANANSTPVFLKHCGFEKITSLDVKIGIGKSIQPRPDIVYKRFWTDEALRWRLGMRRYTRSGNYVIGTYSHGVKTIMGLFDNEQINHLPKQSFGLGVYLYVGKGAKLPVTFTKVPPFIKHSPFNVIFRDLTGGKLPPMTADNLFYQLLDYDVV